MAAALIFELKSRIIGRLARRALRLLRYMPVDEIGFSDPHGQLDVLGERG
jgi:hypothetical protein